MRDVVEKLRVEKILERHSQTVDDPIEVLYRDVPFARLDFSEVCACHADAVGKGFLAHAFFCPELLDSETDHCLDCG